MFKNRPVTLLALLAGITAFGLATGGSDTCTILQLPGSDKILGVYNGCTEYTSDVKHGDGSCGSPATHTGTYCHLEDTPDTYYERSKHGTPCLWCDETSTNYTYKSPDTSGGPCTVTDPGSPAP